jgi:serine/threonine-protein kinase
MVVPTSPDDEYGAGSYPARSAHRPSRGYRDPFLQRWLFSRRILIVLGALLLIVITWWLAEGQYFAVPRVAGMAVSTARADLSNAGLVVVSGTARHSDTVPGGDVITTSPAAGARIRHGGTVTLIASLGPVLVSVPPVTGQSLAQADATLKKAGLIPAQPTYQTSSSIPQGVVIATDPVAYQHWPKNKPVHLVVSAGPPLPNFVGQQIGDAQAAAQQGGFSINQVAAANSTQPPGTIVRQVPAPGTPITSGEVVQVWVSAGPAQVAVPDVTGMTLNQAEAALTAAGFQVSVNQIGPGHRVITYSPQGNQAQGSTITITVGFGF